MHAILLHNSPIYLAALAARTCSGTTHLLDSSGDSLGPKDEKLLSRKVLKLNETPNRFNPPHESVIEHLYYTFDLGTLRAVLQHLTKHRIASTSVESTRVTMHRVLKNIDANNVCSVVQLTGILEIDTLIQNQIVAVANLVKRDGSDSVANDKAKLALCEAFNTRLIMTINARSLRNFLALRTAPQTMQETRDLAYAMFRALPEQHKFLFTDCVFNVKQVDKSE